MTVSLTKGVKSTPTHAMPITPAMAGCWFAGASNRTADELNAAVIVRAITWYGWEPSDKGELFTLANNVEGWCDDSDDSEWLIEAANNAQSYLCSLAPDGYAFEFDEGFYLMPIHDIEGADPRDCECGADHSDDSPGFALYV